MTYSFSENYNPIRDTPGLRWDGAQLTVTAPYNENRVADGKKIPSHKWDEFQRLESYAPHRLTTVLAYCEKHGVPVLLDDQDRAAIAAIPHPVNLTRRNWRIWSKAGTMLVFEFDRTDEIVAAIMRIPDRQYDNPFWVLPEKRILLAVATALMFNMVIAPDVLAECDAFVQGKLAKKQLSFLSRLTREQIVSLATRYEQLLQHVPVE